MFFTVSWFNVQLAWWGNEVPYRGCEGRKPCTLHQLAEGERFYPWWDTSKVPAP